MVDRNEDNATVVDTAILNLTRAQKETKAMNKRGCYWHWSPTGTGISHVNPYWICCYLLENRGEHFKWVDKLSLKSFCLNLSTLTVR